MKKASIYIIITLGILLTACQNKEKKHINYKDTYESMGEKKPKKKVLDTIDQINAGNIKPAKSKDKNNNTSFHFLFLYNL